jgi:hypothetical protein
MTRIEIGDWAREPARTLYAALDTIRMTSSDPWVQRVAGDAMAKYGMDRARLLAEIGNLFEQLDEPAAEPRERGSDCDHAGKQPGEECWRCGLQTP